MLIAVEGLLRLECLFRSRRLSRRFEDLPPAARLYPTPDQFGSFSPFLHGRAALSWADASPWPHRSGICIPAILACHPIGLLRRTAAVRCPRQRLICPDEVSIDGRGEPLFRLARMPMRKTQHRSEAHILISEGGHIGRPSSIQFGPQDDKRPLRLEVAD